MLCIQLKTRNSFYCLAAEEYLLKNFSEDIFLLWQSENTVVVGKHQNAMAEINYPYVHRNGIRVARRISGGGTVYHDEGNVNFGYILNVSGPSEISFTRFMKPIIEALGKLDVQAETSGRNDLLVAGKKISGNAEHIFKNRVLHHGTLLYNSNLETLGNSIKVVPDIYHDKAVQSKRSVVTNILPFLKKTLTLDEFIAFFMNFHLAESGNSVYEITEHDNQNIRKLEEEKFNTWEWNFGYSPKYTFQKESRFNGKSLTVELKVEKGIVSEATVSGDFFSTEESTVLNGSLQGERHSYTEIYKKLKEIQPIVPEDLLFAFF